MDGPPGSPEPQPAPAAPAGAQPTQQPPQNGKAIASLILGIAGCCFFWMIGPLASIPAVILGHMARKEIRESQGAQGGDGMALTGVILGWIGVGFGILFLIILVIYGIAIFAFIADQEAYCDENPDDELCQDTVVDEGGIWAPAAGTDNGHKRAYEAPGYALPGQSMLFPGSEPSSLLAG